MSARWASSKGPYRLPGSPGCHCNEESSRNAVAGRSRRGAVRSNDSAADEGTMQMRKPTSTSTAGRLTRIFTSGAISVALLITLGAAAAPAARARAGAVTDYQIQLDAVSVLSSSDAWAVGDSATVLHWNGTGWVRGTIPGLPAVVALHAVAAVSSSDVWAVGEEDSGQPYAPSHTLIVHWDGTAWTRVPSPGPSTSGLFPSLVSLSMVSATDGWAVGSVYDEQANTSRNLALHWTGTSWQRVAASPAAGFTGVASFLPSDVTAVGDEQTGTHTFRPAAFHWNGTNWSLAATPPSPPGVPASHAGVSSLSAPSATDMWAIGSYYASTASKNLAWHWNGTRWAVMALPSPGVPLIGVSGLTGAAAISPANVWDVGFAATKNCAYNCIYQTVSLQWNGTKWTRVATPDPGGPNQRAVLLGIGAAGPGNIWAVGYYYLSRAETPHT